MNQCKTCIDRNFPNNCNYGELTSLGGEIKVKSCYAEYYDEDLDGCLCGNYEVDEKTLPQNETIMNCNYGYCWRHTAYYSLKDGCSSCNIGGKTISFPVSQQR